MKRRVAIFGSTGQLGTELVDVFTKSDEFDVISLAHENADCTDAGAVRNVLHGTRPQIVINSAAYVRVDDCEDHAREAFDVNAIGALNIARVCAEVDALCVYISTDYVFDGTRAAPYLESDPACPINVYGASKLAGEFLIRQTAPRWLITRAASLFGRAGARGKAGNFVETILAKAKRGEPLAVVNDVRMSPTYARDAATALVDLIEMGADGMVHLTNDGACTWYEFAQQAVELAGLRTSIAAVSSEEYPSRARRPKNSALASERAPVKLRSWQDALKAYLIEKGHMSASLAATAHES
jgi:dTDP-4-dehydrorhamnose reductase